MADIIVDETLQMYIEESREHLEDIETDLLEIEQQGADIDSDLVNKVFRAAHSIKGGASFLALGKITDLSHKIENILDMVRNQQLVPSGELISTVLEAFDYLGDLLNNAVNSNEMDISSHLDDLNKLVTATLDDNEKEDLTRQEKISMPDIHTTFTLSTYDLKQATQGGKDLYILEYDLIEDVHRQGNSPLDIFHSLENAGFIIDVHVGMTAVGDLDSPQLFTILPMYVFFASIIEPDLIAMVLEIDEAKAQHLSSDDIKDQLQSGGKTIETAAPEIADSSPLPVVEQVAEPVAKQQKKEVKQSSGVIDKAKSSSLKQSTTKQAKTVRVDVQVLDQLINRAGELVLARNQMLQALSTWEKANITTASQRIDLVTSELQEAIMLTRMQPIGNIFNKFTRVIRDLSRQLGKEIDLQLEGKEVELDKTIIEGLGDPLTHLVRNSVDHGIEPPETRKAKGKQEKGTVSLRAYHESGQVIIEIEDDGKGLNPVFLAEKALEKGLVSVEQEATMTDQERVNLIMMPGFSTAEKLTDVSGRGVGMDVVKTNLDELGGQVEINSELDRGTVIRIKLPLTLAIIPSLLVSTAGERFAIPQVNVGELLQIPGTELKDRIERIGEAEVLVLRGELIPLLQLASVLELEHLYFDKKQGVYRPDRRKTICDKRLDDFSSSSPQKTAHGPKTVVPEAVAERRYADRDLNVVVVQSGAFKYGMIVDAMHDTVEIVVKSLGRHLNKQQVYAGATIMGDGNLALILDVAGVARAAGLRSVTESSQLLAKEQEQSSVGNGSVQQTLLFFRNGPEELCAVPLHQVMRIEQIKNTDIEIKGGKKVIQYRNGNLPVYALEEVASVEMLEEREELNVILFSVAGHEVGLLATPPLDIVNNTFMLDEVTLRQSGISGSTIINNETILMVDIIDVIKNLNPQWFTDIADPYLLSRGTAMDEGNGGQSDAQSTVVLVEDSDFFRSQVKQFINAMGYPVVEAENGREALEQINDLTESIGLVVTDIEMPIMNGYELAAKLREDERFSQLPIIALSSLANEEDVARGKKSGINEFQVKLDREQLAEAITRYLG